MAKSTKAQEASTGTSDSYTEHELSAAVLRGRPMLGGELKSAGTNSSRSSKSAPTPNDKTIPSHQAPVPTTENPSGQQETAANSSAASTGGDGPASLNPSDEVIINPAPKQDSKARVTSVEDDDDFANM
jgi:hypothetical protein